MITIKLFSYTEEEWNAIKLELRRTLDLDADQIELEGDRFAEFLDELGVNAATRSAVGGLSNSMQLRTRIEWTVARYSFDTASTRQSPRRTELIALHEDAANLRARIHDALSQRISADFIAEDRQVYVVRDGVDPIMALWTQRYFIRLLRALDHQIEQAAAARARGVKLGRQIGQRPSDKKAKRVLGMHTVGLSYRLIARNVGLSKNTVMDIVRRKSAG